LPAKAKPSHCPLDRRPNHEIDPVTRAAAKKIHQAMPHDELRREIDLF